MATRPKSEAKPADPRGKIVDALMELASAGIDRFRTRGRSQLKRTVCRRDDTDASFRLGARAEGEARVELLDGETFYTSKEATVAIGSLLRFPVLDSGQSS